MSSELIDPAGLVAAFARLAAVEDATGEQVLEAAAMGVALAELGLLADAPAAKAVASRARKVLLGAAAMRAGGQDEEARDALELALEQARRGVALLAGGALTALDGAPTDEPTPRDVALLFRGALDGFAAADVALRLHRSGARARYAAFLPARPEVRVRLAADAAPAVRDPGQGRALGGMALGDPAAGGAALEAYAFADGAIAIYAEPPIDLSLASIDVPLSGRPARAAGYLELRCEGAPERVVLVLEGGAASATWPLDLAPG